MELRTGTPRSMPKLAKKSETNQEVMAKAVVRATRLSRRRSLAAAKRTRKPEAKGSKSRHSPPDSQTKNFLVGQRNR
jgi:hypothetical protein